MLGTIQRRELDAWRLEQQIDRARALSVAARMVGEQTDTLASNEVHRVGEENLDAGNDAGGGLRGCDPGGNREAERERKYFEG